MTSDRPSLTRINTACAVRKQRGPHRRFRHMQGTQTTQSKNHLCQEHFGEGGPPSSFLLLTKKILDNLHFSYCMSAIYEYSYATSCTALKVMMWNRNRCKSQRGDFSNRVS